MKYYYLILIFCSLNLYGQKNNTANWKNNHDIPRWAVKEFNNRGLDEKYIITYQLYPSFLQGDFNGDKRKDVAILVAEQSTNKLGIAIIHGKHPQALRYQINIIGAGESLGDIGDNFKWVDIWNKFKSNSRELNNVRLPAVHGDVINLQEKDKRNGIIFWDGRDYNWRSIKK